MNGILEQETITMLGLLLALTVILPLAWLASEFQPRRWLSILLGCAAIAYMAFITYGWAGFQSTFSLNESYGAASKSLAKEIVQQLEAGKIDLVQRELKQFANSYEPNYENYPRYDEAVAKVIGRLQVGK